ncbi:DUF4184 family protein [Hymenobacter terrestris]|uniref:DUF4184 family protein n=1 Tax=Hymenobacter terrestris TaxID=2748310 RepID=A0ABX2Q788_9BACT|nr:DUF4184 family protein [Hymenobacter terrestris]NVO86102.1 DUF4184 family protein [Hymenobacter terrestris]
MPFTFFHPAIILPARNLPIKWKKYVSMTGLITGSLAPDFEKFIQMRSGNIYSHTLAGVFGFDLPVALLLAVVFHGIVKATLIDYLPTRALSGRFVAYKRQNWIRYLQRRYVLVILNMLVGISSHLVLDSITHTNGVLVHMLPVLDNYYQVSFLNVRGYQLLELCYYLFASLSFYLVFISLPQKDSTYPVRTNKTIFWIGAFIYMVLIIYIRLLINPDIRHIWDGASLITAAALGSLLLSCLIWRHIT